MKAKFILKRALLILKRATSLLNGALLLEIKVERTRHSHWFFLSLLSFCLSFFLSFFRSFVSAFLPSFLIANPLSAKERTCSVERGLALQHTATHCNTSQHTALHCSLPCNRESTCKCQGADLRSRKRVVYIGMHTHQGPCHCPTIP